MRTLLCTRRLALGALALLLTLFLPTAQAQVVGWGHNDSGRATPPAGLIGVVDVAAGGAHSLAVKDDGTVVGWGNDSNGQATPPAGLTGVVDVAAGSYHSLALKDDGTVVGWGDNAGGRATPPAGLAGVVDVSAGSYHSLALKDDGTVVGWGADWSGMATPPAGLTGVVDVAAGSYHSLALKDDGTVVGWGNDSDGQATPPAGLTGVVAVSAGGDYSLALKGDGTVVGWGQNGYGRATPPAGLAGVVAISAGMTHSLALKDDGTVVGWGHDTFGQATPSDGLAGVVAVSAGSYYSLALAPPVEVAFSVDMTFEPLAPGEVVGVRGGTAPLGWESTTPLADDDGDGVWTGTVAFPSASAGSTLEYKFVHHDGGEDPSATDLGNAGGFEGDVGPDVDGDTYANRILTLPDASTALPTVFWNNLVLCSTEAPLAVGAFNPSAGTVTLANGSTTEEADLADCTLAVFDPIAETVTDAVVSEDRVAAGGSATLEASLTAGPGAFALVEGSVAANAGVADVLGRVVAAVVYGADGSVYGACGNGAGVAPCASPEAQATLAAALAAAFGGAVADEASPDAALDLAVWPNPSTGATRVAFGLAEPGAARVAVYDALGREVAVVADGSFPAGSHEAAFDARALPAGVYVVRSVTADGARTARLTVAR